MLSRAFRGYYLFPHYQSMKRFYRNLRPGQILVGIADIGLIREPY